MDMSGNCTLIFPSCCSETGNGAAVVGDGGIELKMKVKPREKYSLQKN